MKVCIPVVMSWHSAQWEVLTMQRLCPLHWHATDSISNNHTSKLQSAYLYSIETLRSVLYRLHSSDCSLLAVPQDHTCFSSRSFAVAAPPKWNSLPLHTRNSSSISGFRQQLKAFLYKSDLGSIAPTHLSATDLVVFKTELFSRACCVAINSPEDVRYIAKL